MFGVLGRTGGFVVGEGGGWWWEWKWGESDGAVMRYIYGKEGGDTDER